MITELRRYRIKPGRMESWLSFFAEAAREQVGHGLRMEYAGVDAETDTFVWLRSFADEPDRKALNDAFYGSDWWNEREDAAMSHVIEYDVTFLDAALIRDGGQVVRTSWPAAGDRAGSTGDSPPDGWTSSTRRTYVPER